MAGGLRAEPPPATAGMAQLSRLTVAQILLIAAIVGVVLGMAVGIVTLLMR